MAMREGSVLVSNVAQAILTMDVDLVLLDILIPTVNGQQVLKAVRAKERCARHHGHIAEQRGR